MGYSSGGRKYALRAANYQLPVPTVYALFHDDETDFNFIVQEFIPGKTLEKAWPILSDADKTAVASQLRRHMDELRSIPAPGYYGGIWRQPIQDYLFTDVTLGTRPHLDETISRPQEAEEQWPEAMWRCLDDRVYGVATYLCRCKDDWWKGFPKFLDEWVGEAGWMPVHLKYVLFF